MFEKLEIFRMAGAMAQHATARQSVIAENIAQADTPGYKARDVAPFAQTYKADDSQQMRKTRAGHLLGESSSAPMMAQLIEGQGSESPNGNNVSLESEMMKAVEVGGQHKRALAIYQTSLNILRTSLGRR